MMAPNLLRSENSFIRLPGKNLFEFRNEPGSVDRREEEVSGRPSRLPVRSRRCVVMASIPQ
jgi:hypothetical protein